MQSAPQGKILQREKNTGKKLQREKELQEKNYKGEKYYRKKNYKREKLRMRMFQNIYKKYCKNIITFFFFIAIELNFIYSRHKMTSAFSETSISRHNGGPIKPPCLNHFFPPFQHLLSERLRLSA